MAITLRCPGCGAHIRAKDEHAGKKGRCKQCGMLFGIPTAAAVTPARSAQAEQGSVSVSSFSPGPPSLVTNDLVNTLRNIKGFRSPEMDARSKLVTAVFCGFLIGGFIGFLLRPSFFGEKLPLGAVISRGATLEETEKLLGVPLAERSFNTMLTGAILGALITAVSTHLGDLTLKQRQPEQSALRPRDRYGTR